MATSIPMKILSAEQIRATDEYTIAQDEDMSSWDLMERASKTFIHWFYPRFKTYEFVTILCGKGNNGGDGLAVARLLAERNFTVSVFILDFEEDQEARPDFKINLEKLEEREDVEIEYLKAAKDLPIFDPNELLIDAIMGTGLTRPLEGEWAELVRLVNEGDNVVVSVDTPTGVFADKHTEGISIYADYTFAFEMPRLAFFFPENYRRVGEFASASIGLDREFIAQQDSPYTYVTKADVLQRYRKRKKFEHKGNYGHALLIVGSYGKMGAAVLASRACLRSGAGLATVHVPVCGYEIMQISVPEAMVSLDEDEHVFTRIRDLHRYPTIGIGCGLSTKNKTRNALCYILKNTDHPLVLDADALNILGQNPDWFNYIPPHSILTPHPKEFERLFGKTKNDFDRNELQRRMAEELQVYIVLKGANTCIATPKGYCYFNSTGNPGMGTAGSGDVLTGVLTALLAQGYSPKDASILGVYIHGLAGDKVAERIGEDSLVAGDIIEELGYAFLEVNRI